MADKDKIEEEELVPVGEGVEEEESSKIVDDDDDDDDDDDEDERVGAGEDDDDEKLAKRKEERKTRRQRQKEARDRDKRELDFLRQRNESLEQRFSVVEKRIGHSEVSQVDTRINDIKSKIKLADQVIAKAITSQDGDAYTEAQSIRDNLRDNLTRLEGAKVTMASRVSGPNGQEQPAIDPRLVSNAQKWMESHTWWDPNGGDSDSRRVSAIDAQMVREGFDPTTSEYWDELTNRVKEALPERAGGKRSSGGNGKGKGPRFATGGRERPLKKNEVYVSPERKKAMEDAGVWDDPVLRQKYLKSYANYDREAGSRA